MCGVQTMLSSSNNLFSFAGSSSYTSSPAPEISPSFKATYNASSSITPPRAALKMRAVSFMILNSSVEIECLVSSVKGTWIVMMSALFNTSSCSSYNFTPMSSAT